MCGWKVRHSSSAAWRVCATSYQDSFASEDFGDHLAQIQVVFHDEDARLLAGNAQHLHSSLRRASSLGRGKSRSSF